MTYGLGDGDHSWRKSVLKHLLSLGSCSPGPLAGFGRLYGRIWFGEESYLRYEWPPRLWMRCSRSIMALKMVEEDGRGYTTWFFNLHCRLPNKLVLCRESRIPMTRKNEYKQKKIRYIESITRKQRKVITWMKHLEAQDHLFWVSAMPGL